MPIFISHTHSFKINSEHTYIYDQFYVFLWWNWCQSWLHSQNWMLLNLKHQTHIPPLWKHTLYANIVIPLLLLLIICIFNHAFGSNSVMLAAILDFRHPDSHKIIKYLQNWLPWPQKHIYRHQHHYSTILRTEVMRKVEFLILCGSHLGGHLGFCKSQVSGKWPISQNFIYTLISIKKWCYTDIARFSDRATSLETDYHNLIM